MGLSVSSLNTAKIDVKKLFFVYIYVRAEMIFRCVQNDINLEINELI
jgi:hypothetical protein